MSGGNINMEVLQRVLAHACLIALRSYGWSHRSGVISLRIRLKADTSTRAVPDSRR